MDIGDPQDALPSGTSALDERFRITLGRRYSNGVAVEMSIQPRDRKLLWGRSGNRCAICRRLLVVDSSAAGDPDAVVGEEAHIVARSAAGPRGSVVRTADDGYENLILLCALHHKVVDDQPAHFTTERLRAIKADHEAWVRLALESSTTRGPRPIELPMVPIRLVNRESELLALTAFSNRGAAGPIADVIVLTGMHGVGKSALCAHWAMQNWDRYTDGQLVGRFSGGLGDDRSSVDEVLTGFLHELGIPDDAIPPRFADRRRLFREASQTRRLLVLLDDVREAAEVTALRPTGSGSLVIATSNYFLEELLYEGAGLVEVEPLDPPTSARLLVDLVGEARLEAEPEAVARLIELCVGLPLALRVCGGRLAGAARTRSIASLVAGIESAAHRLEALSGVGSYRVDAIFDVAYQELPAGQAATYRALGLYPGGDIIPAAVARLRDVPVSEATAAIDGLQQAHLVDIAGEDRFRLHELVAHHARTCALRSDTDEDADLALRRLVAWFYAALQRADRAVYADRLRIASASLEVAPGLPSLLTPRDAFRWFARDHTALTAAIRTAGAMGWDERVCQFAEALWPLCYNLRAYTVWFEVYEAGAAAAERLNDSAMIARLRSCLARAYSDQGEFGRSAQEMGVASAAADRCDHPLLKASVAEFGAIMAYERGDAPGALDQFRRARNMYQAIPSERGVALVDYHLAKCFIAMAAYAQAIEPLELAESGFCSLGDEVIHGRVLRRKGEALAGMGDFDGATAAYLAALEIAQRQSLPFDEAETLESLATVAGALHDVDTATEHLQHAVRLYEELGHPRAQVLQVSLGERGAAGA